MIASAAATTMVAGVVEPPGPLTCPGLTWDALTDLKADDPTSVYVAIRAVGALNDQRALRGLTRLTQQADLDWRVKLEAHASLALLHPSAHTEPIATLVLDPLRPIEERMEAVFVLSDLPTSEAADALARVAALGSEAHAELRAAAVWGLGRGAHSRPDLVLPYAVDPSDLVSLHAIVALQRLPDELLPTLAAWLHADDRHAASAATILARHQQVPTLVEATKTDDRARLWALNALGRLRPEVVQAEAGDHLTDTLYSDLQPLWITHDDWLRDEAKEGLEALSLQTIRLDPVTPMLPE